MKIPRGRSYRGSEYFHEYVCSFPQQAKQTFHIILCLCIFAYCSVFKLQLKEDQYTLTHFPTGRAHTHAYKLRNIFTRIFKNIKTKIQFLMLVFQISLKTGKT